MPGMDADPSKPLPAFGFLTVLESAQQILYGPTLRPYLLAEVIGQTLVAGSELAVRVILTDQRDMLPLGLLRSECIVHVERAPDAETGEASPATAAAAAHAFDLAG